MTSFAPKRALWNLDELCTEAGAVEVLEADERIWKMRRNCQESVRLISLVSLTDMTLLCRAIKLPMRLNLL